MDTREELLSYFKKLSADGRSQIIKDLEAIRLVDDYSAILHLRGDALDNKAVECPHCSSPHYHKNGKEKGTRKYKCKSCCRAFTEYTGTWLAGIHQKDKIPLFLEALELELSLTKSSERIGVDPVTVFNWRHRFLSSQEEKDTTSAFKGITETDETYYLHSQKGKKCTHRLPRKRGGRPTRGITNEEASVLTTMDRSGNVVYELTNMGRMSFEELKETISDKINDRTILCSDGSQSYKKIALEKGIDHYVFKSSEGKRVNGEYHIQNINNLHSRMKSFFNHRLRGVSTKYLQKYLNWQRIKDQFRGSSQWIKQVLTLSVQRVDALKTYHQIGTDYQKIYKPS